MKKLLLIMLLVTLLGVAVAQIPAYVPEPDFNGQGLGVHFGTVSANGFSYRNFSKSHGFQVTVGGITLGSKDIEEYHYGEYGGQQNIVVTEDGRRTNLNVGLNYLQTLASNRTGRFYVFGGASYLFSRVKQYEIAYRLNNSDPYWEDGYVRNYAIPEKTKYENRNFYYLGAGLGFDFNLGQNFHWVVELPLTVDQDQEFMMYIPQTGLYYYFR